MSDRFTQHPFTKEQHRCADHLLGASEELKYSPQNVKRNLFLDIPPEAHGLLQVRSIVEQLVTLIPIRGGVVFLSTLLEAVLILKKLDLSEPFALLLVTPNWDRFDFIVCVSVLYFSTQRGLGR